MKLHWLLTVLLLLSSANFGQAQRPTKIPRLGYFAGGTDPTSLGTSFSYFRQALQNLGYIEGKNILLENPYARLNLSVNSDGRLLAYKTRRPPVLGSNL